MSDGPREADASLGGQAVDQGARAAEGDLHVQSVPTADEAVEALRQQLTELEGRNQETAAERDRAREAAATAERARAEAETRAAERDRAARQVEQQSQRSVDQAQLDAVSNSLVSQQGKMSALETQLAAAMTEGDFEKAAKVQSQMSVLGGQIATLEAGKEQLEERVKNPPADTRQGSGSGPDDQREQYIRSQPAEVQAWLRGPNGQRFFFDRQFQEDVSVAAGYVSRIKKISPSDPRYIEAVEVELGLRTPSANAENRDNQQQQQQQPAGNQPAGRTADTDRRMVAAPAGGANAGSVRTNPNGSIDVYLTKDEKEQAARSGISEVEWAKHKKQLLDEGLIGPGARNRWHD